MTVRFYVMPMVLINAGGNLVHRPKYIPYSYSGGVGVRIPVTGPPLNPDPLLTSVPFHLVDQGIADICLLAADVDAAQHAALDSHVSEPVQSDVVNAVPANLDNTIGANLAVTKTRMRAWNIPANWLTAGTTWRQLVRGIFAIFQVGQVLDGAGQTRLWPEGVTLNTTIAALDPTYSALLFQAIDGKGYDRSSITGASTMEDLMEILTSQAAPDMMLGVVI
jgi:hypothetical protein